MYIKPNVQTFCAYLQYIQTDRYADRQNRQTQKKRRQTDRQYMCAVQKDSGKNSMNLKVSNRYPCIEEKRSNRSTPKKGASGLVKNVLLLDLIFRVLGE
jgi:hypothetical protein